MRAKILSSTSTFNGVSYNTAKTQNSRGELMKFRNFGYLQNSRDVSPDELKTFLKAHSNRNSLVKDKQFHAMISCKGKEYGKGELTKIAEEWLHKMGYGDNPYLIVYHSDTKNNHVHLVSSRINADGKKIKDSMERVKTQAFINEIMKMDPKRECGQLLQDLRSFNLSTLSQAKLFLETRGFGIRENGTIWELFKYGTKQGELCVGEIEKQAQSYLPNSDRIIQLKAIFGKYRSIYNSEPIAVFEPLKGNRQGKQIGYRSEWSEYLKEKFGLEIIYHGKEGKAPYGYTILDHSQKQILKGSEVLSLREISKKETEQKVRKTTVSSLSDKGVFENLNNTKDVLFGFRKSNGEKNLRLRLMAAIEEYSTLDQGLTAQRLKVMPFEDKLYLLDTASNYFIDLKAVLDTKEYNRFAVHFEVSLLGEQVQAESGYGDPPTPNNTPPISNLQMVPENGFKMENETSGDWKKNNGVSFSLSIGEDADDEAVHRRGRRKKGNPFKKHR